MREDPGADLHYFNGMQGVASPTMTGKALAVLQHSLRNPNLSEEDIHTLSRVIIQQLIKAGLMLEALNALDAIKKTLAERGASPDATTYNYLLKATKTNYLQCLDYLDTMRKDGIKPNTDTYHTLLLACHNAGKYAECGRVWQELTEQGVKKTVYLYDIMMRSMVLAREPSLVLELFEELKSAGIQQTAAHHSYVLEAYAIVDETTKAIELYEALPEDIGKQLSYSVLEKLYFVYLGKMSWARAVEVAYRAASNPGGLRSISEIVRGCRGYPIPAEFSSQLDVGYLREVHARARASLPKGKKGGARRN